jgi:hypothetical protein
LAVGLLAAGLMLGLSSVQGALFGGQWSSERGSAIVIVYADSCADPSYRPIIEDAAALWNRTTTPAAFVKAADGDTRSVRLMVCTGYDDGPDGDYWGVTHLYDAAGTECLACKYSSAAVFLNRSQLDGVTTEIQLKTATHELGHVLGLAHPASNDRASQVMRQGWNGYYDPQAQDIANLNSLYQGWPSDGAKPSDTTTYQALPAATPPALNPNAPAPRNPDNGGTTLGK